MSQSKRPFFQLTTLLSFVFLLSGFSSLVYQVVWQRLLTVYYGVGSVSIVLIVSVYMLGLGLGALLGGFWVEHVKKRVRLYFFIELLIGCFGIVSLSLMDFIGRHSAGCNYAVAFFFMFLFLSIPTFLMGMTLPLLTKIFNRSIKDFLRTVSFLYFVNTIGAALGSLFAAYVLISLFGLKAAVYFAAAINFILAGCIFYISKKEESESQGEIRDEILPETGRQSGLPVKRAYLFVFVTGFLAIGYEIIWLRVIEVLLKASPYVFSTVLFVYLSGIAVGSFSMGKFLGPRKSLNRKNLFFILQFLIGLFVLIIFCGYYHGTPKYPFFELLTKASFRSFVHPDPLIMFELATLPLPKVIVWVRIFTLLDVFFWPLIFVFLPTVLMGASFPLISSLALRDARKESETIGKIYFANILGNVLGGVVTGFVFLVWLGTERTVLLFVAAGILFGILAGCRNRAFFIIKNAAIVGLLFLGIMFFPKKGELYKVMHLLWNEKNPIYLEEGREGVVVTYEHDGRMDNYINGFFHGGRPGHHFYQKTIEAASFAKDVEDVLLIGFGTGSIAETVLRLPEVKSVTIVELNGTLMRNLKKMPLFQNMLSDPRIHLIIDDGRRFLLKANKAFDLILTDPLSTTTSYSNNLYSREFFALVKSHLKLRGILMTWMDESVVVPKTILSVFDCFRMYNSFVLTSNAPMRVDQQRKDYLLSTFSQNDRLAIMALYENTPEQGEGNSGKFLAGGINGRYLAAHFIGKGYPINENLRPVSEYYLGLFFRHYCAGGFRTLKLFNSRAIAR